MNRATVAQQAKTASFLPPAQGLLQRKCACGNHTMAGGKCAECAKSKSGLQRKLAIGASNDPLEQEADRVADQVLTAPAHLGVSGAPPRIQRYAGQATEGTDTAPASVDHVLASSGRPLESALQQDMGQRFGYDFSKVRVHSGAAAEQSARDVRAHAYTVGSNIVFGASRFAAGTQEGRRLIAHELTHVVQQSGSDGVRVDQSNEQRRLARVSHGVDDRLIQRDSNTPASGSAAPTLDQQYNTAVQTARQTGNWEDAAEKLNGFNREDIQSRLAKLTPEEVGFIHQGALDRVGPDSNVAQMTAPGTHSRSNAAAGAGGGRSKRDADNDDDPRADERNKQKRQQERRQQRQEKATEGRAMDKCSEMGRIFESKDAVLKAIREELLPQAAEGNTPSTITGNKASHPVGHIGIYNDSSKKEYAGTVFSQRCLDENGKEKMVWTTNIEIRKETTQSKNSQTTQGQVVVSAKPVITDLHSALISSSAILQSQAKLAFPQAQTGSEFFFTTSPEIVEKYLNPLARESFRKLASVQENRQFRTERTFYVVALGIFGAELLVAIAGAVGAGAAGAVGTGAAEAVGTGAAGGGTLAPVITLPTRQVVAAAAAVTLVLRGSEAGAGEPPKQRTLGDIKTTPAALIGSQARSIGSVITVGAEKNVIVGRLVMQ